MKSCRACNYNTSANTNISQLGVTATTKTATSRSAATLVWYPTTGEFGPRAGFGDLENHRSCGDPFRRQRRATCARAATRRTVSRPTSTQIRLSDGVFPFETGALADGVTVEQARLRLLFGRMPAAKIARLHAPGRVYYRDLSNFAANGPVPQASIKDRGFMAEAMQMVVPKTLGIYAATGYVDDEFKRYPWELAGGASFYPYKNRSWRLNLHVIHVEKSPTGSTFGYYSAGQTGTTVSMMTDILF